MSAPHLRIVPHRQGALAVALEKGQVVAARIQAVASGLASANDHTKRRIANGTKVLSARSALVDRENIKGTVDQCASDLHELTETLSHGIEVQHRVEAALTETERALALTAASLVTARQEERRAILRAMHDSATGLPNRELFDDRLAQAIALSARRGWTLAVLFLDLDRFKHINDGHGHAAGDAVIKEVARRLLSTSREEDTVCRTGGDEFLVLLMAPGGRDVIERIAIDLKQSVARPIDIGEGDVVVHASIGIAVYPDHGATGDALVRRADAAMYRAKQSATGEVLFAAQGPREDK